MQYKLVRDNIPKIMADQGIKAKFTVLGEEDYKHYLEKKLDEEVNEYHESKEVEELADILEVVYALGKAAGFTSTQINNIYREKHKARGGFDNRILLISEATNG